MSVWRKKEDIDEGGIFAQGWTYMTAPPAPYDIPLWTKFCELTGASGVHIYGRSPRKGVMPPELAPVEDAAMSDADGLHLECSLSLGREGMHRDYGRERTDELAAEARARTIATGSGW
jgi:hypothetical protein